VSVTVYEKIESTEDLIEKINRLYNFLSELIVNYIILMLVGTSMKYVHIMRISYNGSVSEMQNSSRETFRLAVT